MRVEVEQQLQQRGRSDVAPEEQLLDRVARHVAQGGQQLEQRPVPVGRPWPAGTDVGRERFLRAFLQRPDRRNLADRFGRAGRRRGRYVRAVAAHARDARFRVELALVQDDRAQIDVLVRVDAQRRQLGENLLEDLDLLHEKVAHGAGFAPVVVQILVRDQQLAEVDRCEVLGHGQDEELAPRLLEQHELVRHRELRERGQALEEVDVHEEQLGGRLPDRVDRDERMGRRHASCAGEQGRRWQIRTGGRCRRWRRQERVAPERQIQPHRRLLVMVMVVPVMMMVMMGMVVAGVRDRDAGR
uniref:Uncharacterized protein n=1 Tax=Anopheles merus TaxID=30066 RepID=A0A182VB69_ANOME